MAAARPGESTDGVPGAVAVAEEDADAASDAAADAAADAAMTAAVREPQREQFEDEQRRWRSRNLVKASRSSVITCWRALLM